MMPNWPDLRIAQDREGHCAISSNSSLCKKSFAFWSCGLLVRWVAWDYSLFTENHARAEVRVSHFHLNQICTRQLMSHPTMQTWANADKPTRDCVADSDKDLLKICEVTPGGLEHVHETVDIKILHPKNKTKRLWKNNLQLPQYPSAFSSTLLFTYTQYIFQWWNVRLFTLQN